MKAIILAGGFGTRLKPVSGDMPKCMMPVMGIPMVELIMRMMRREGITDITLSLHYKPELFIKRFGDKVKYKIESEPLGTGGAIRYCMEGLAPTLVSNGDTICPINYSDMLAQHAPPLSIAVVQNGASLTSAGVYIINQELFDDAPKGAFSFEQFISNKRKKFYRVPFFNDFGTPESYAEAPKEWV